MIRLTTKGFSVSNFWSSILWPVALTGIMALLIARLSAGIMLSHEFKTKPLQTLDNEIRHEVLKPNILGYSVVFFPQIDCSGYTHSLDLTIDIKGMPKKSIPEIEQLHATIYKEFLRNLNSLKCIRPFLASFPLSPDSFSLSIGFLSESGRHFLPPYFVSIIMDEKNLEFVQLDKDNVINPGNIVLTKPIQGSEWLKQFYHTIIEKKINLEQPHVPEVTYILRDSPPHHHAVFDFAKTLSKKFLLNFVSLGPNESPFEKERPFEMVFWAKDRLSKDAARNLAAKCSIEFLNFVQNDKRTLEYMDERSKNSFMHDNAILPEVRHIGFRISFWDENIDRQPAPYIAEIRVVGDKFKYFTSDENQRLVLAYEETFEDAQAYLKSSDRSK